MSWLVSIGWCIHVHQNSSGMVWNVHAVQAGWQAGCSDKALDPVITIAGCLLCFHQLDDLACLLSPCWAESWHYRLKSTLATQRLQLYQEKPLGTPGHYTGQQSHEASLPLNHFRETMKCNPIWPSSKRFTSPLGHLNLAQHAIPLGWSLILRLFYISTTV